MMRRILAVVAFCGVVALALPCTAQDKTVPPPSTNSVDIAPPVHPATEDQVREYLSLIRADTTARDAMMAGLKGMRATAAPYYPAAMWDDMEKAFLQFDIASIYVPIYQKYLSRDEMQAVIDFYRSPAGKRLLAAQPLAIRDAQEVVRVWATKIANQIAAKYADQIQAAQKRYESGQSGDIHLDAPDASTSTTPKK